MSSDIVSGALVLHDAFEEFGVILRIENGSAVVLFDDNETRQVADLRTLKRVQLNDRVKRLSSGQTGFKLSMTSTNPPKWKVLFSIDEPAIEIHEADLRPDMSSNPFEQVLEGRAAGEIDETLITTAAHYLRNEHKNNDLVSLDGARVDVQPHQVSVVHRVVSNRPHRYLLCDEVGLGKTIEAGMIIKELRARGEALRVLIIVPASLTRQWQFELKSKFNESFSILNSETLRVVANDGREENPFTRYESVIVSKDWISSDARSELVKQAAWDLIIVDEAHHARKHPDRKTTKLYDVVKELTDIVSYPDRAVLLLTATPMQLSSVELYSLIEMIDPTLFPSLDAFNGHRQALPQLNELASSIDKAEDLTSLPDSVSNLLSDWLEVSLDDAKEMLATGDKAHILDELGKKHLITEVLIRNRKVNVLKFKERLAHRWNVQLTPEEKEVIDAIEDYVETGYRNAASSNLNSIGFLMTTYQKMMASSLRTIRDSLERRRIKLEGLEVEDSPIEDEFSPLLEDLNLDPNEIAFNLKATLSKSENSEITQLRQLVEKLDAIKIDSKAQALINNLEELANSEVPKVLIFTEYRGTQNYLASLLSESGWNVNVFHGSQTAAKKDEAVQAFRSGEGRQVLIATEAGAEGRNFQFCHMLINYDLPWNPMTVEQRIGRIDRMGQENTVMVFNFCVIDSIEERILDVLERRINLFEVTVGGLDPILGEVADDLRSIMQKAREERPAAIEELGKRLEAEVRDARRAGEKLQDLFMDTKSYSVEIARRIEGQRGLIDAGIQEEFMKRLLKVHNTFIQRDDELKEYKVHFHRPFSSRHQELFNHADEVSRRVVFRNDERSESEFVQYMAFGHPVIEAAIDDVVRPQWAGSVGARRIPQGDGLSPSSGWLMIYEIEIIDVKPRSLFIPAFISDQGNLDLEIGEKLVVRSLSGEGEVKGVIDSAAKNYLREARVIADAHVAGEISKATDQLIKTAEERVGRETKRLQAYYDNLIENCQLRIRATQDTIDRISASEDEGQMRIIPAWQKRLSDARDRISILETELTRGLGRLNALKNPSCTSRLLQVVRIEIGNE